jgi:urease accessory protein
MMKTRILVGSLLAVSSSLALAHPGHGIDGSYAGFLHPFTGLDHLLVMLAVGLWAAKIGGKARWQLPLTFMLVMGVGAIGGYLGLAFNGVETAIAASVMAMGVLLAISLPLNASLRMGLVALFALLHGLAHGTELTMQSHLPVLVGMLLATGMLHLVGFTLGSYRFKLARQLQALLAWGMMLAGAYLLVV